MSTALLPTFRVVARVRPLAEGRVERTYPVGCSIADVVSELRQRVKSRLLEFVVNDSGVPIASREWHRHRPPANAIVSARVRPKGRGSQQDKDIARVVAFFAAMAASNVVFPGAGTAAGVARGAFTAASWWAVNKMIGEPDQEMKPESKLADPSVSCRITPNEPFPRIYGRMRVYPSLAVRPWYRTKFGVTYVYLLYNLGFGPIRITDVQIGETPIEETGLVEGVTWERVEGRADDCTRTIAPPVMREDPLDPPEPIGENDAAYAAADQQTHEFIVTLDWPNGLNGQLNWRYQQQYPQWPTCRIAVGIRVQARPMYNDQWGTYTSVDPVNADVDANHRFWPTGATSARFSRSYHFAPLENSVITDWLESQGWTPGDPALFMVQVHRTHDIIPDWEYGDQDPDLYCDSVTSTTRLAQIDSIEFTDPIDEDAIDPSTDTHIATIGVRARIDSMGDLQWDRLNCMAEAELVAWNGSTWAVAATRSPAAAFRDVLQGTALDKSARLADARLDFTGNPSAMGSLERWAEWCEEKGYEFNGIFSKKITVRRALDAVAAVGFASPAMRDGSKFGVVYDYDRYTANTEPAQAITPRNSWGLQCTRRLGKALDGMRISFTRRGSDYSYLPAETIWLRPGLAITYPTKNVQKMEAFGVVEEAHVADLAAYHTNYSRLRRETWQVYLDIENLVAERGDLIAVSTDVALIGEKRGRVTGVSYSGDSVTSCTIDEPVYLDGADHRLLVRTDNMTAAPWIHLRTTNTITYPGSPAWVTSLAFTTAEPAPNATRGQIDVGDVFMFGVDATPDVNRCRMYLVAGVEPEPDYVARLALVEEASNRREDPASPGFYDFDEGSSYLYDGQNQPWPEHLPPPTPVIGGTITDETVMYMAQDGTLHPRLGLQLEWDDSGGDYGPANSIDVEIRVHPFGTEELPWEPRPSWHGDLYLVLIDNVTVAETYDARIRARTHDDVVSPWVVEEEIYIDGWTTPPPAPTGLVIEGDGPINMLRWSFPGDAPPIDLAGFEIRRHAGSATEAEWSTATKVSDQLVTGYAWPISNVLQGTFTFYVAAVDIVGNYSSPASAVFTFPAPDDLPYLERFAYKDWQAEGWPGWDSGESTNCYRHADGTLRATDPTEDMIYETQAWTTGFDPLWQYKDSPVIVVPDFDVTADCWYVDYKPRQSFNVASGENGWECDWFSWPGRVALRVCYALPGIITPWIGIKFRITCRGQASGQATINGCSFRRAFPPMVEMFGHSYSHGEGRGSHLCSKDFTHLMTVSGTIIEPTPGADAIPWVGGLYYCPTHSKCWFGAGPVDEEHDDSAADWILWICAGFRSVFGPGDPDWCAENVLSGGYYENEMDV